VRLAVLTTFVASFLLVVFYTCVGCGQVLQQWIQSTVGNTTDASAAATADGSPRTFSIGGRSILPALGNGTAFPTDLLNASNIVRFPAGVPINLLPLLLRASRTAELTRDDVALLKVGARLSTALSRPLSTALSNPYLTRDDVALLKVTTCLLACVLDCIGAYTTGLFCYLARSLLTRPLSPPRPSPIPLPCVRRRCSRTTFWASPWWTTRPCS